MRSPLSIVSACVLLAGGHGSATGGPKPLKLLEPGDRVVFLGDSITNAGFYIACVDAYLRLQAPDSDLELVNLGLGSETASSLSEPDHPFPRPCIHQRLEAVLEFVRPDVVFFCYGMNDGIYYPPGQERFRAYQDGVNRLVSACRDAGARAIALTPPPFDALSKKDPDQLQPAGRAEYSYKVPYRNYDEVLQQYGHWLLTECDGLAATIDLHEPLAELTAACRRAHADYRSGDGIHPHKAGHLAMALEILDALGFDRDHARKTLEEESGLSLDPADLAFADPRNSTFSPLLKWVDQRLRILLTSYREHTGHGHPRKANQALPPETAKAQANRLDARIRRAVQARKNLSSLVHDRVRTHLRAGNLVGAVTLVAQNGRIQDLQGHGLADREADRTMQTDAIFRIHSFTKALTSAAALMHHEQGTFAFDDPISQWLPQFARMKVGDKPARHPILVRHLLTHSSGISYENRTAFDEKDLATMASVLAQTPLAHEPGRGWTYGASIDVLGRLIEVWSGQSYESFLREQLLEPLDMHDTAFHVPDSKRHRLAMLYKAKPGANSNELRPWPYAGNKEKPFPSTSPSLCMPGGGLYSTARDYHRFLQMIQNGGELEGRRYLEDATIQLMRTNQLPEKAGWVRFGDEVRDGFGYGFGFNVVTRPSQWDPAARPGEFGWGGLCSCHYWMHPDDRFIAITLEQTLPYRWALERALKQPLYDHLQKTP